MLWVSHDDGGWYQVASSFTSSHNINTTLHPKSPLKICENLAQIPHIFQLKDVCVLIINIPLWRVEFGIWLANTTEKFDIWNLSVVFEPNSTLRRRMFLLKCCLAFDSTQPTSQSLLISTTQSVTSWSRSRDFFQFWNFRWYRYVGQPSPPLIIPPCTIYYLLCSLCLPWFALSSKCHLWTKWKSTWEWILR